MTSVTTSISIDKELKEKVTALAKSMGLSFSQVAEQGFRQFLVDQKIEFAPYNADNDSDLQKSRLVREGDEEQSVYQDIKQMRKEKGHHDKIFENIQKNKAIRDACFDTDS